MALYCNCRRVVGRVELGAGREAGEWRVVKSHRWDCPSCGLDRKRTLATMCATAAVTRMLTLTFEQPAVPGPLMACSRESHAACEAVGHVVLDVERHRPARHRFCDWRTHGYWYVAPAGRATGRSGWRWRLLPGCAHCCRWVSGRLALWRKRMRRAFPAFEYLHAREVHKSGALHVHVAVRGVPASVTRKSKTGQAVKAHWKAVGGGFLDVGRHGDNAGWDAGWYVGKYLAKSHGEDEAFARGFRRWSRTAGFAPAVLMRPRRDPDDDGGWDDPGAPLMVGGWVHPDGVERGHRWWPHDPVPGEAGAGLDPRTAKCPRTWLDVLREACQQPAVGVSARWDDLALF